MVNTVIDASTNFDLLIDAGPDGYRARVINTDLCSGWADFKLPVSLQQLRSLMSALGRSTRNLASVSCDDDAGVETLDIRAFGQRLFDAVFSGQVGKCFDKCLGSVEAKNAKLRIRFNLTSVPELADLPWEFLYSSEYLALSTQTMLVRYLDIKDKRKILGVIPPITLLVVVSDPSDVPRLNVEEEWKCLQQALMPLIADHMLNLERLPAATLTALMQRLGQGDVHVIHFIGHGFFDAQAKQGGLVFEDEARKSRHVVAEELGVRLQDHPQLRMIFLNACEGAKSADDAMFAGVSQTLIEQGVPAVLAMQSPITDSAAILLAQTFYQCFASGMPIDIALTEARKGVFSANDQRGEWGTPVLFSSSSDNCLIEIVKPFKPRYGFEPESMVVLAGDFQMGSEPGFQARAWETPRHAAALATFCIARTPITNRQYAEFVAQTQRVVPPQAMWMGQTPPSNSLDQPVRGLTFLDAVAYCEWLQCVTGRAYRLPTEAEWERAAGLPAERGFVWGVVPEWTATLWGARQSEPDGAYLYPWRDDGRNDLSAGMHIRRVIRGVLRNGVPCLTAKEAGLPDSVGMPGFRFGFRVAISGWDGGK